MGNPPPLLFSYGKSPPFHSPPPMGNSQLFIHPPLWEIPKKNLEKNFFFGIYGQLFPQKWGCPLGRGGTGGYLPPPMGYMGGGDCLLRLLIKITCSGTCSGYILSVLLILFILAVSDAMLSFIFVTFLLWRYLL